MSKVFIEESTLSSIGNAIRQKTGKSELISPGNMPTEIASITTGSSGTGGDEKLRQILNGSFSGEYVDNNIKKLRSGAFYDTKIKRVDCPNVSNIPTSLFHFCSELLEVNLPKAVDGGTSDYAFYYCVKLTKVNLPLLKYMGSYTFAHTVSLKEINLPSLIQCNNYGFQMAQAAQKINVPLLEDIGMYGFQSCGSLVEITLPSLCCIGGAGVFQGDSMLKKVDLPIFGNDTNSNYSSPGKFQSSTFNGCSSLDTLILRNSSKIAKLVNPNAFTGTPIAKGTGYIYVPAALIDEYKTATNWARFADQFRAIEDYPDICGEAAE